MDSGIRLTSDKTKRLNMTPFIDVSFLLIIFFVLVCQYIVAENFPVTVPDRCPFAQGDQVDTLDFTTVTVMKASPRGTVQYAIGPEIITALAPETIAAEIAEAINARLKNAATQNPNNTVVCLRADKDITFRQAQHALAGIAASSATDIQLAVFKDRQSAADR